MKKEYDFSRGKFDYYLKRLAMFRFLKADARDRQTHGLPVVFIVGFSAIER